MGLQFETHEIEARQKLHISEPHVDLNPQVLEQIHEVDVSLNLAEIFSLRGWLTATVSS